MTLTILLTGVALVHSGARCHRVAVGQAVLARRPEEVLICPVEACSLLAVGLPALKVCPHDGIDAAYLVRPIGEQLVTGLSTAFSAPLAPGPRAAMDLVSRALRVVLTAEPVAEGWRPLRPDAPLAVRQAVRLLVDGRPRWWTVNELAATLRVDTSTLERQFKAALGCGLGEFLQRYRVEKFTGLATLGGITPAQASAAAGYRTERSALEAFERAKGMPLTAFLRQLRGPDGPPDPGGPGPRRTWPPGSPWPGLGAPLPQV